MPERASVSLSFAGRLRREEKYDVERGSVFCFCLFLNKANHPGKELVP